MCRPAGAEIQRQPKTINMPVLADLGNVFIGTNYKRGVCLGLRCFQPPGLCFPELQS